MGKRQKEEEEGLGGGETGGEGGGGGEGTCIIRPSIHLSACLHSIPLSISRGALDGRDRARPLD